METFKIIGENMIVLIVTAVIIWVLVGTYAFTQVDLEKTSMPKIIFAIVICGPVVWFCALLVVGIDFWNGN